MKKGLKRDDSTLVCWDKTIFEVHFDVIGIEELGIGGFQRITRDTVYVFSHSMQRLFTTDFRGKDVYPPAQNPAYPQVTAETQPSPYPQTEPYPPQQAYPAQQQPSQTTQQVPPQQPPPQGGYPPPPQAGYPPQQPGYQPQPGYPSQQFGYAPVQQQQTNTTVVVTQQPAAPLPAPVFKDHPVIVVDSNGQQVQTVLRYRTGCLTWLICCLICWITGGCWIIALIPCCINGTKDVVHITPTDGKVVGVYKRL